MEFSQFVMSVSRLYRDGKILQSEINKLLKDKKINEKEYKYIISCKLQ